MESFCLFLKNETNDFCNENMPIFQSFQTIECVTAFFI